MNAQTQQQQPSGNGATANTVRIQARGLTIVSGAAKTATLIGTFVNVSGQDDALISVVVSNPTAKVSIVGTNTAGGVIPLPRTDSRKVGWDSTEHINLIGFEPTPSQFVTVELVYRDSGRATAQVLVVPPAGIYEGISPQLVPGA